MKDDNNNLLIENIQKAKDGDAQAFEYLYEQFYVPLFRFIKWRINDQENAADFVQDVFLKWYQSLSRYEVKMKPVNYLYVIAMRLIINDSQKKNTLQLEEDAEEFIADETESLEEILDTEINFSKVREIIDTELNDSEKNIISLKYLEEKNNNT